MRRLGLAAIAVALCAGCANNESPTTPAEAADFHGLYSGSYRVANCVEDGFFLGFCEATGFDGGSSYALALSLTQSQTTATGSVNLGGISGTFVGSVSGNTLTGSAVMSDLSADGLTLQSTVTAWSTTISGNSLAGGFTLVFRVPSTTGSATLTGTVAQLTR